MSLAGQATVRRDTRQLARVVVGAVLIALVATLMMQLTPTTIAAAHALQVDNLTTEHRTNPLGIDASAPRFGWIDTAGYNGATQVAYQIRVSSDDSRKGDMWDSGRVTSADSFDVVYAGKALDPKTRYYWSVRVWSGESATPSRWSERAWFETAFLDAGQFAGDWIGRATNVAPTQTPEVLLRKDFNLPKTTIASARAYIAGLGYNKLFLNGAKVGNHELDPARTAYDTRTLYVTYDVTEMLQPGANTVGISLGHSYYTGYETAKLELDVTFANGRTTKILSDDSWQSSDGPTLKDSVLNGETYDARLEQPGWNAPGFDASAWDPAIVRDGPGGRLAAQDMEPIRVTGTLPTPVSSPIASTPDATLYDFRTTRAGWGTVTMSGPAGAEVTIKFGEKLLADGTVQVTGGFGPPNQNTLQTYHYTLRGGGPESYTPSYSYSSFRYIEVDGPDTVTVSKVVGNTLNSDVSSTGDFTSSSDLFNRYHDAMRASILSNLTGIPTDTPMYEKNGWTADSHLFSDSALLNFSSESFWENWMLDHMDVQNAIGQLPTTIPIGSPQDAPIWTASYIIINWNLYQYRGDLRTLQTNYAGMKLWVDHYQDVIQSTDYIYTGFTYGDHEPAGGGPDNPSNAEFPRSQDNRAIGTAYIYEGARMLAEIARTLHKPADAAELDAFADTIRDHYNAVLYDPVQHLYSANPPEYRQTDNLVPLAFGLVPDGDRQAVCDNLIDNVHVAWEDHLSTGAVGTKLILPILTECGQPELAYKVATNPTYPGWGWWFQTINGLNTGSETLIVDTMWEAWCWFPSSNCLTDSSRSHNHAFRGTVDDWLFQYVAGIKNTAPGYREIQIKPYPLDDMGNASAYITSPLGKVSSSWTRSGANLTLKVHIPVGATATVMVPVSDGGSVSQQGGATYVSTSDGYASFTVGSGDYVFTAG